MFTQLLEIADFMVNAFLHIWPYLLITIPLAVAVHMSGAAKYINRALRSKPLIAILLAALVGAFSPFCSCGVIPVITALLLGGVPLAPVMTFWIASPSMDPEIFFLSVATIGWELAVWRLAAALILSLTAGFMTHFLVQRGWLGEQILRTQKAPAIKSRWELFSSKFSVRRGWNLLKERVSFPFQAKTAVAGTFAPAQAMCSATAATIDDVPFTTTPANSAESCGCQSSPKAETDCDSGCDEKSPSFSQRLASEIWKATAMVVKFMALAFFLEALIKLYVPSEWISGLLGRDNPFSVLMAALIGVPVYTTNLAALPMMSALLAQGMNPGAVLAFLIAGPMTTLPAMAAVWGITSRRIFVFYVSVALIGSLIFGHVYSLVAGF